MGKVTIMNDSHSNILQFYQQAACMRFLTLSPPIPLRLDTLPYWSNLPFLIFDICTFWCSVQMSKIKNGALDQYGAEPFEQQQFGTAGIEGG